MKKVKLKIPAKINLTLDVLGVTAGYHEISSLVTSIDVYDYITIKARKDDKITLSFSGIDPNCAIVDNNAYKSAKLFMDEFKCTGVDVKIKKTIPVGAGLGGSSADIAGVLKGMKELYNANSVVELANRLGSDASYMLTGGWAVLNGRGDKQEFLKLNFPLYLILILEDKGVSAKQCYQEFDRQKIIYPPCTKQAKQALMDGNFDTFIKACSNHLYLPAVSFVKEIRQSVCALEQAGAPLSIMTGSGSTVLGVFDNKKQRDKVYKKLKKTCGKKILKAKTL